MVFKNTIKLMKNKYFGTDGIKELLIKKYYWRKFFKFSLASGTYFKNQKNLNRLQS